MIEELLINKPDQAVIDFIKQLLLEAESGELQSIAVVTSLSGYRTGNGWMGMNKNNMAIVGEIEVLKRDVMDLLIELRVNPETGDTFL